MKQNEKNEIAVEVKNVTARFNMASEKIDNLKEYFIKLVKRELMFEEFLALKNVSFSVKKGESWGIIGINGSGKSTLLKVICGILKPYKGTVTVNGTIAPLIELGAGFDGDLTARENIYLNGAVLGHDEQFMKEHFDEIVEFAELEKFLDMPIKNYSSGMAARLGFAIATVVKPDILICDEVLAVGDYAFQRKCEKRMKKMREEGTTLLYVSHSMESVRKICDNALWLKKGVVRGCGTVREVSRAYLNSLSGNKGEMKEKEKENPFTDETCSSLSIFSAPEAKREGTGLVHFTSIELLDKEGKSSACFDTGDKITIRFQYASRTKNMPLSFAFGIVTKDHTPVYRTSTALEYKKMILSEHCGVMECHIDKNYLLDGQYYLEARIWGENLVLHDSLTDFIVLDIKTAERKEHGFLVMPHGWNTYPIKSFFDPETKFGFEITEQQKKVWAIELEMADRLLTVCRENNLKIFADAGTMLGAVRHKGFIPWDDDMDFAMFREDYDKLCEIAPRYFTEPYFFQNVYTDKKYVHGHAQIRNSYTTGILSVEERQNKEFNQGIFIDLFVLENVSNDVQVVEKQRRNCDVLKQFIVETTDGREFEWPEDFEIPEELKENLSTDNCWKYIDDMFRSVKEKDADKVAPLNFIFDTEKRIRDRHMYDETIWMDFEYLKMPVPAGYDAYLTNRYGDYMTPQNVSNTHGGVIFDTEMDYKEYLSKLKCDEN